MISLTQGSVRGRFWSLLMLSQTSTRDHVNMLYFVVRSEVFLFQSLCSPLCMSFYFLTRSSTTHSCSVWNGISLLVLSLSQILMLLIKHWFFSTSEHFLLPDTPLPKQGIGSNSCEISYQMPCWDKYCTGSAAVGKALLQTPIDKGPAYLFLISKCK